MKRVRHVSARGSSMYKSLLLLAVFSNLALSPKPVAAQTYAPELRTGDNVAAAKAPNTANAEAKALYKTGLDLLDSGQLNQAASSFEQAVKLDPEYADAYEALGRAYFKMREWQ